MVNTMMMLHDIDFTNEEIEKYMRLLLIEKSTGQERMKMLKNKRGRTLDEIHFKEG